MTDYLKAITNKSIIVYPKVHLSGILSDDDDHIVLDCAVEAKVDLIVTADKGLLELKNYQQTAIAHPRMLKHWFPAEK